MSRRKYQFSEAKIQKYLKEGRGTGDGANYRPWLTVYDVPSTGRSHRVYGIKTGRIHYLLSDGEWKSFIRFEFDDTVLDIREQFPLDRRQTMQAACKLGYKHPITTDGTPYVMTIDFLLTRRVGDRLALEALSFKYNPAELKERETQLHEIAAECVQSNGLTLRFIDETYFEPNFIRNYDSIRGCFDISALHGYDPSLAQRIAKALITAVKAAKPRLLEETCYEIAAQHQVSANEVFTIAKHLLARGVLACDLSAYADLAEVPMSKIWIRPQGAWVCQQ
jgi:hypothetical protein